MFDLFRLVLRELSDTPCSSFRHVFPGRDFYLGAEWQSIMTPRNFNGAPCLD